MQAQIIERRFSEITFVFKGGMKTLQVPYKETFTDKELLEIFSGNISQASIYTNPDEIVLYETQDRRRGYAGTLNCLVSFAPTPELAAIFDGSTSITSCEKILKLVKKSKIF